jgi:hypothetical protein
VTRLELVPITLAEARLFIATHHRHAPRLVGWKVGVGISNGELRGVAVLSRPVARKLQAAEPRTIEIVRVCTLGDRNANSRLYGAACRAAAALGYTAAVTYTLESENGSSLRAAGFTADAEPRGARGGQTWNMPTRPRYETDLFGDPVAAPGPKVRWRRELTKENR